MVIKELNGFTVCVFEHFMQVPGLIHGISTRMNGKSHGAFSSLNLGPHTSDRPDCVQQNRQQFFDAFGIQLNQLAIPEQVHETRVSVVREPGIYKNSDSLITMTRGIFLTVQTADCVPVLIIDPVEKALGIIHAGWRGTVNGICGKTVALMNREFGSQPSHLLAGIGPCIRECCFQVGEEVSSQFHVRCVQNQHIDLSFENKQQLVDSGLKDDYITTCNFCTSCNNKLFFSHRRDHGVTGRMITFIGFSINEPIKQLT